MGCPEALQQDEGEIHKAEDTITPPLRTFPASQYIPPGSTSGFLH